MNVPLQVFSAHMTEFVKQQLSWMGWNLKIKAAETFITKSAVMKQPTEVYQFQLGHVEKPA